MKTVDPTTKGEGVPPPCCVCGDRANVTQRRGAPEERLLFCSRCWDLPAPYPTNGDTPPRWSVLHRGDLVGRVFVEPTRFADARRSIAKGELVMLDDIVGPIVERWRVKVMTPAEGPSEGGWHTEIDGDYPTRLAAAIRAERVLARDFGVAWQCNLCGKGHVRHPTWWCEACEAKEATSAVLGEVKQERDRQTAKWGVQNHPLWPKDRNVAPSRDRADYYGVRHARAAQEFQEAEVERMDPTYFAILAEEVSEAICAVDEERARGELVQVAAVAVAMIEAIDRKTKRDR